MKREDNDELTTAYLAGCYDTRKAYEQRLAAAEADKKRLRGQLQHCVQKLSRVNRGARDRNEYTDAIDSANRAIYEIFECPQQEASGKGGVMSDIPDTNDINKLAAWFDKDILELIGHILNKHTKACLSQMEELVIERKELKKRLAEAEAKLPRWIPVGERLPEGREGVLVCLDNIKVRYGYHLNGGWYEYTVPIESYGETVTHWMPRPEAPKSGKGE